ncbi:ras and Rab interactor 2 [Chanos chanos]|uniref:Ras and Rab interactor 2 n=1 Tax=Chanos chanos TaxID=29144 RepID=A0A6J2W1T9_CHACN|nr:ras and Rab interactor 2-like [Chanos chanos]
MKDDPVYDYPDPQSLGEKQPCPQRASLKRISVLDRLLLTHPVWLQLSINSATALHILQREPPGTFLVRKSNTLLKKVLCVRLADDSIPSFVKQFVILEEDSTFSLENSAISFPDLCRLIAFYCVSRDVLPFTLELPEAIAKASSHKQLESISHMGVEFWSSQLNFRGPRNGPSVSDASLPRSPAPPDIHAPQENPTLFQEFCPLQTRSPLELDLGAGKGALCFINPLFLHEHPGRSTIQRSNRLKQSFKVRVSTETSGPLSPPVIPPPPPPLLAKAKNRKKAAQGTVTSGVDAKEEVEEKAAPAQEEDSDYMHPSLVLPKKLTPMTSPALSPTVEEDDYQMPKALLQAREKTQREKREKEEEDQDEEVGLVLEQSRAPSLSELDSSSSFSSLEEAEESPESVAITEIINNPCTENPAKPRQSLSALRKMSAAFMSFFVPEKRVALLLEHLSRDRQTAFGSLVQDFLTTQREKLKSPCLTSASELLQGLRLFLTQAKAFLLECGELQPPIETLLPEDEQDQALEKAMFRCVLKPLKSQIDAALHSLHEQDGSTQRMMESLKRAREGSPMELFGVHVGVPDAHGIEKVKQKLSLMCQAYSPINKVLLLLQVCKLIYKAMRNNTVETGQEFGADEFLPALSYVLVQCDMPELCLEVEYMMELLETQWLTGEGGYYLTSVYASLSLIQSQPEAMSPSGITRQVRDSLREWSSRRRNKDHSQKKLQERFVKVLFQDGELSVVKTLQWRDGVTAADLTQLCAEKIGVTESEEYALYRRSEGDVLPLAPDTQIQDLQNLQGGGGPSLIYKRCPKDSKTPKLKRGNAVDITELS